MPAVTLLPHSYTLLPQPSSRSATATAMATPDEAAVIVAAIERFVRETTPTPSASQAMPHPDAWRTTSLLEGVSRDPWDDGVQHAWLPPG